MSRRFLFGWGVVDEVVTGAGVVVVVVLVDVDVVVDGVVEVVVVVVVGGTGAGRGSNDALEKRWKKTIKNIICYNSSFIPIDCY